MLSMWMDVEYRHTFCLMMTVLFSFFLFPFSFFFSSSPFARVVLDLVRERRTKTSLPDHPTADAHQVWLV